MWRFAGLAVIAVVSAGCGEVEAPIGPAGADAGTAEPSADARPGDASAGGDGNGSSADAGGAGTVFAAASATVSYLGSTTLTWSFPGFEGCAAEGQWLGPRDISGSQTTGPLTASTTYQLQCQGSAGGQSLSLSVAVTNAPASPTQTLAGCDAIVAADAPYSNCGVYDGSNQIVCYCSRASQRVSEAFFSSDSDRQHWHSVYPDNNVVYTGATQFAGARPFMARIAY